MYIVLGIEHDGTDNIFNDVGKPRVRLPTRSSKYPLLPACVVRQTTYSYIAQRHHIVQLS